MLTDAIRRHNTRIDLNGAEDGMLGGRARTARGIGRVADCNKKIEYSVTKTELKTFNMGMETDVDIT